MARAIKIATGQLQQLRPGELLDEDQVPLDSGEHEYSPGLKPALVTAAGNTDIFAPAVGTNQFRIHWSYAVPIVRSGEVMPVITIRLLNVSGGTLNKELYIAAAVSKRQLITAPLGTKLAVNLDIAGRVACTFLIEEFTP